MDGIGWLARFYTSQVYISGYIKERGRNPYLCYIHTFFGGGKQEAEDSPFPVFVHLFQPRNSMLGAPSMT